MSKNTFKVKVNDKEVELKTINVNSFIRLESNTYYSKAFNEAVDNKMKLRIQMEKLLESQGLLDTKEDEAKATAMRKELRSLEIQLRGALISGRRMTKAEGRALALKMRKLRDELGTIGQGVASYFSNTVESYADNERLQYFVYACTVYAENGARYWKSYDEFKLDSNTEVYTEASRSFLNSFMGLSNSDNDPYEVQWLKRMKFMNSQGQLTREDGKTTDEDGRLIDKDGRFINEDGDFIDIYGNRIDADGNLVVEDGWVDSPAQLNPSKA